MGDFFSTEIFVEDFRQGRMTAWARLKILVKVGANWWVRALSTLPGSPSGAAFLGFTARSTRLTSCSCIVGGVVQEPKGVGGGAGLGQMSAADEYQSERRSSLAPLQMLHSDLLLTHRSL